MKQDLTSQIEEYLEHLRPALQSDGGDIEFVALDDQSGILQLRFVGACSHCSISDMTLSGYIKEQVLGKFSEIKDIALVP